MLDPAAVVLVAAVCAIGLLAYVVYVSVKRVRDRALALSRELTEQNRRLAQRERDLQMIMDSVPAYLASFNLDFRLRDCNARYAEYFKREPAQLWGQHAADFMAQEVLENAMPHWNKCLAGSESRYRRISRDPTTGQVVEAYDIQMVPERDQGRVVGVFVLGTDVTEQVATEHRIRELNNTLEHRVAQRGAELELAMEKLQASAEELARSETKATLNTLTASLAHEFSTPLDNSLLTAGTLAAHSRAFHSAMESDQPKRSDLNRLAGQLREGHDILMLNLQRATELLKKFRQVANDQASEQRRRFDLAAVLADTLATLAPSLRRYPHTVTVQVAAGIGMDSFPGSLTQVVINLVNNAYLHAFEGRTDGLLTIDASADTHTVVLRFSDNGVGIPAENLSRLFAPFFSTKLERGGTGLGLNIVEHLVKKSLGGTVTVSSTVGAGTCFELRLPRVAPGGG
jgi:signal transduction histidine kinase